MHPEITYLDSETRPTLEYGEVIPTHRAAAYRALAATVEVYPRCPSCRRALLYTPTGYVCPDGHYLQALPVRENWWSRCVRLLTFIKAAPRAEEG